MPHLLGIPNSTRLYIGDIVQMFAPSTTRSLTLCRQHPRPQVRHTVCWQRVRALWYCWNMYRSCRGDWPWIRQREPFCIGAHRKEPRCTPRVGLTCKIHHPSLKLRRPRAREYVLIIRWGLGTLEYLLKDVQSVWRIWHITSAQPHMSKIFACCTCTWIISGLGAKKRRTWISGFFCRVSGLSEAEKSQLAFSAYLI